MKASSCEELLKYIRGQAEDDDDLILDLQMRREWNEASFRRIVQAAVNCLDATGHAELVSRELSHVFVAFVPRMIDLMNHTCFLQNNAEDGDLETVRVYFEARRQLLRTLSEWFVNGGSIASNDLLSLDGWSPTRQPTRNEHMVDIVEEHSQSPHSKSGRGCEALREYLHSLKEGPCFGGYSGLEWDEASFRSMVQVLVDCLEATEEEDHVPRVLARMFVLTVPAILAKINRRDFLHTNSGERSLDEAQAYFTRRKQLLEALSLWFINGRKVVRDERLSASDWSPLFRPMRGPTCDGLSAYLRDHDVSLWFRIRSNLEWDEASYRRMVQALVDCLEATEQQDLVPRMLARIFVFEIPSIDGMTNRSDFLERNAGGRSPEEVQSYFANRKRLLRDLSSWFTDGRRLFSDERLSAGDWSPAFRRTHLSTDSSSGAVGDDVSRPKSTSGCGELLEYLQDVEGRLWCKLGSKLGWDEASFRRMVQVLIDCLEATEQGDLVPRPLACIFIVDVPEIDAMMNRPEFLQLNAGGRSPGESRAYFARRWQLLRDLSSWFTNGRRLIGDERLSVGDWSPSFRPKPSVPRP